MTSQFLQEIIEQYGDHIFGFCCYLTGSRPLAEDLYQEVFLTALEKKKRHRFSEAARTDADRRREGKNYLIGMAVRLWKNERRRAAKKQEPSIDEMAERGVFPADETDMEDAYIDREKRENVRRAISQLPDKLRLVMNMHYSAEMSVAEIARELHIPEGTVKSRMHKARIEIKKGLKVMGYEI